MADTPEEPGKIFVPLTMGDKIVGKIHIAEEGTFVGQIDKTLVDILNTGFTTGILEVGFFGKPGRAAIGTVNRQIREYLDSE